VDPDEVTRRMAAESSDATAWFERLYAAADQGHAVVPWDRGAPNPFLVQWAAQRQSVPSSRALVVGCGLGADAQLVAGMGWHTVAFDISPTAVSAARRRFPDSGVDYRTADLFDLPGAWQRAFDFVLESLTVQSLPRSLRSEAIARVAELVAPGGTLLVIAAAQDADEPDEGPPWPLTRAELDAFADDLEPVLVEDIKDPSDTGTRRWRAEFRRRAR
jgi:SAM-dependent methyltransferase